MKTSDVIKVAKALLEFGVHHEDYGDNYPYDGFECSCCDGEYSVTYEAFRHDLDCPILIVQDLLTLCE